VSRRWQLVLFGLGALLFAQLVVRIGVGRLWADAAATGWMILPIVLLYGVVHAYNTRAWQLIMLDEPGRPRFARTYAILVAGCALNFITPMVNAGGEPYKVAALAPELGTGGATGFVILHAMVKVLGFLLVWLTALVLGLVLLPHTRLTVMLLAVGIVAVGTLIGLLLARHRRGMLAWALDRLGRIPGLKRVARSLEPRRAGLVEMDRQITDFYHRRPRRFAQALTLEYLSRCLFMLELCLIGASIGVRISYLDAFVIGGLEALITNLLFFVPFELGTREGATLLLFQQLGYAPGLGLYAALVSRVRDLLWIAAGLLLIWTGGRRPAPAENPGGVSA